MGSGVPTQYTRRPVARRGPHTMLTAGGPPSAANPPERPCHTTHYNMILYSTNGKWPPPRRKQELAYHFADRTLQALLPTSRRQ